MNYAPPTHVHVRPCRDRDQTYFLCPSGHPLWCHYPLGRREAAYSHLPRYAPAYEEDIPELDAGLQNQLLELSGPGCEGKGVATVNWEMEINVPDGMSHILQSPVNLSASAICRCTVPALLRTRSKEFD